MSLTALIIASIGFLAAAGLMAYLVIDACRALREMKRKRNIWK